MDAIYLLGPTVAVVGDRRVAGRGFGGVKPRQLLELLALTPGRPVSKGQLAELLWDGAPPRSWVATLEAYVSGLRRALDPDAPVRRSLVVTTSGGYRLDERAHVDLTSFVDEVRRCSALPAAASLAGLTAALDGAGGVALQDEPYTAWAIEAREAHQRLVLRASLQAGQHALDAGQAAAAAEHGRRATDTDPLDERGWRMRMQAAWADGDRRTALNAYTQCRDLLHEELGVSPAPVTQQLHQRLLAPVGDDLVDALLGQLVDVLLAEGGAAADGPGHRLGRRTVLDANALAARIAGVVQARTARTQRQSRHAAIDAIADLPSAG
jgi:DNA-binding SARP family transcriptional activator